MNLTGLVQNVHILTSVIKSSVTSVAKKNQNKNNFAFLCQFSLPSFFQGRIFFIFFYSIVKVLFFNYNVFIFLFDCISVHDRVMIFWLVFGSDFQRVVFVAFYINSITLNLEVIFDKIFNLIIFFQLFEIQNFNLQFRNEY